jgi:predicted dehydrogenase
MQAGKHVLCEKPFAISVEEVDRMVAASRQTGRVLQEAFMYRHHPQTKLVGEWVREGRLGEIRLVRAAFSFYMGDSPGNVRLVPEYGGGALWDVGIYPISFARFVYGHLPETAAGQQLIGETGVDDSFAGQLAYSDGRSAQLFAGFNVPYFTLAEVHGSLGQISLTRPFTGINESARQILFTPANGKPQKLKVKSPELYLGEIENMNAAILDGQPILVTHEESRDHIRTACALYEAARSQETVHV